MMGIVDFLGPMDLDHLQRSCWALNALPGIDVEALLRRHGFNFFRLSRPRIGYTSAMCVEFALLRVCALCLRKRRSPAFDAVGIYACSSCSTANFTQSGLLRSEDFLTPRAAREHVPSGPAEPAREYLRRVANTAALGDLFHATVEIPLHSHRRLVIREELGYRLSRLLGSRGEAGPMLARRFLEQRKRAWGRFVRVAAAKYEELVRPRLFGESPSWAVYWATMRGVEDSRVQDKLRELYTSENGGFLHVLPGTLVRHMLLGIRAYNISCFVRTEMARLGERVILFPDCCAEAARAVAAEWPLRALAEQEADVLAETRTELEARLDFAQDLVVASQHRAEENPPWPASAVAIQALLCVSRFDQASLRRVLRSFGETAAATTLSDACEAVRGALEVNDWDSSDVPIHTGELWESSCSFVLESQEVLLRAARHVAAMRRACVCGQEPYQHCRRRLCECCCLDAACAHAADPQPTPRGKRQGRVPGAPRRLEV
ncbi:Hypothetical Protein FCC1311_048562 [Hondaea fermentalgiana]|uniref:Uncharacterized protein n=1 Tax=Hondaea fermentalgiana TaxID=2315210 RepID=A0A2R5GDK0_9STRA|nr:Hypothetical Protein FCC1311_048562 [Hondaea fermentalgiana]|eukprot:GBG28635.1 Hypothetical Protein FCC1311_048562 [Hondaea fermentalgiana]